MLAKSELVVGQYYSGHCRNALLARWNGERFIYIRSKFGYTYPEAINHVEDFDGYDTFKPKALVTNPDHEIPMTTKTNNCGLG